jgi:glucose-6-phosphate isomerase
VHGVLDAMLAYAERVRHSAVSGTRRDGDAPSIRAVVNIGIGGSDLGPQMVVPALDAYASEAIECHFVSNVDGHDITSVLRHLRPAETLFVIASKTFTTQETMANAHAARAWFVANGGTDTAKHFVATTTNVAAAAEFGIETTFGFWDWVGGRYSLWSAIGLPIAMSIGISNFKELLSGAYSMDQHFQGTPFERNIPVILGLLGVWYGDFWGARSHAILPYDYYLRNFTDHLQQLDMESNGKSVRQDGTPVSAGTGPVIWGGVGCNGQHAYHQLLHQGTQLIPADFIVPVSSYNPVADHHQWLFANCLSQSQALMLGKSRAEAEAELRAAGLAEDEVQRLAPHKVVPGNRPSNTLVMERISPRRLGALIAMYEHKVYVQSVLWGINGFDQWGVELGKVLARDIEPRLVSGDTAGLDPSTAGLLTRLRQAV